MKFNHFVVERPVNSKKTDTGLVISIILSFMLSVYIMTKVEYSSTQVYFIYWKWKYRGVLYSDIKEILVSHAIDYYHFPIKNKNKNSICLLPSIITAKNKLYKKKPPQRIAIIQLISYL